MQGKSLLAMARSDPTQRTKTSPLGTCGCKVKDGHMCNTKASEQQMGKLLECFSPETKRTGVRSVP